MKCRIASLTLLCNVLYIVNPVHSIMGMFNSQRNQQQQHNPIWVPPRICIQRVPVPHPFPVQVPVPFKVVERVEVKVPIPVKVKEPFLVKVPILVPVPEAKKETSTPPPPQPVFIRPPTPPTPFIFHNYVTEPEPKIYTVMPRGVYHRDVHYDQNNLQQREPDDANINDSHHNVVANWHKAGYRIKSDRSPVIPSSLVTHQSVSQSDGHRGHHLESSSNLRPVRGHY